MPMTLENIGKEAFYGCASLQTIELPSNLITIGNSAFYGCESLKSIVIPNSVETLGAQSFEGCASLSEATISPKLTNIEHGTFKTCTSLKSIEIPDNINKIYYDAFEDCSSLSCIIIGKGLQEFGGYPFHGCTALTEFRVNKANAYFSSVDGILLDKSETKIIRYPCCKDETVFSINGNISEIASYAFEDCSNIKKIVIEDSDKELKMGVNLSKTEKSSDRTTQGLFYDCPITEVYLGRTLNCGNGNVFSPFYKKTSLTSVEISHSVTKLAAYLFAETKIDSVFIPNSVKTMERQVFTSLKKIYIEDGKETLYMAEAWDTHDFNVGGGQFYYCPLEFVYLGRFLDYGQAKRYGYSPFARNKYLKHFEIGDSVRSLMGYLLYNCENVDSVYVGSTVNWIGDHVFEGCESLSYIHLSGTTPPRLCSDSFTTAQYMNLIVSVPKGSLDTYQSADIWSNFWNIQEETESGISDVKANVVNLYTHGCKLFVEGIANTPICVYDIGGVLVYKGISNVINLPKRGIYFIRIHDNTIKIATNSNE